jgi:hypothetical protein
MQYDKCSPEFINFDKVLESYQAMYDKHKDDENFNNCLRSRLIMVIELINTLCLDKLLMMPEYNEYKKKFEGYYNINETQELSPKTSTTKSNTIYSLGKSNKKMKSILDKLCYDSYEYINGKVPWGSQR